MHLPVEILQILSSYLYYDDQIKMINLCHETKKYLEFVPYDNKLCLINFSKDNDAQYYRPPLIHNSFPGFYIKITENKKTKLYFIRETHDTRNIKSTAYDEITDTCSIRNVYRYVMSNPKRIISFFVHSNTVKNELKRYKELGNKYIFYGFDLKDIFKKKAISIHETGNIKNIINDYEHILFI